MEYENAPGLSRAQEMLADLMRGRQQVQNETAPTRSESLQPEYTLPRGDRLKQMAMIGIAIAAGLKKSRHRK